MRLIPDIYLHRFEFHQRFCRGLVLDVGCSGGDGWVFPFPKASIIDPPHIDDIVFCDCDQWNISWYPGFKFIRCFAEDIPVEDKSFDTVCLGDILEHVKDPDQVLQEAKRISRDRIIITVPNEWRWPKGNPQILSFETREKHLADGKDLKELGFDSTIRHPSGLCTDALDDTEFEHIHHVRFYDEKTFSELIDRNASDMSYHIYNINYNRLNFVNLAAIMWWNK